MTKIGDFLGEKYEKNRKLFEMWFRPSTSSGTWGLFTQPPAGYLVNYCGWTEMCPERGAMPEAATAGEAEEADRRGVAEGVLDCDFGLKEGRICQILFFLLYYENGLSYM